ncbi:hypothetical protein [Nocardioides solisilvae]|uniref:hypothetical protein n=1 Tax=Nocardioides solisilvae TaxID=1542435 RepID=UPI0013A55134|nr:hypothetical protein [Nocardioides solisilvae]
MATGKRAGARRAAPSRPAPPVNPAILGLAAGITLCVIAWGYLVYAAIDFGAAARAGSGGGWGMLALAAFGAMACLFVGLMLASRLTAALGLSREAAATALEETVAAPAEPPGASPSPSSSESSQPPPSPTPSTRATRQPGGRRIARR